MKGVVTQHMKDPSPSVVDDLEKPEPNATQLLVKSIYAAINPVDAYMAESGLMVEGWPLVLGCDASGVVVKTGKDASSTFKVGDEVCGVPRLGLPGYGTCQEYFLMDAQVAIPKPNNITLAQAATLGMGIETAALGVFNGLSVPLPQPKLSPSTEKWAIILGGASSVGKYAIQLLKASGFNVAASCSSRSAALVKSIGADAVFDRKSPYDQQVKTAMTITKGNFTRIFEAVPGNDAFAREAFRELEPSNEEKLFATTNPDKIEDFGGGKTYNILLDQVGRPEAEELNRDMAEFIPVLVALVEEGKVVPSKYDVVGGVGFESAIEALKYQKSGAGGSSKVLCRLQEIGDI